MPSPQKKKSGNIQKPSGQAAKKAGGEKDSLKLLSTLKMKMVQANDFGKVMDYFFDHFGENDQFMRLGEPTRHELLEQVLAATAKQTLRTSKVQITNGFFIHLPEQQFLHGACQLNGRLSNFFYFEDIDSGMVAIVTEPTKSETQIARFSCQMAKDVSPPKHVN